jgi:hypothetical protein
MAASALFRIIEQSGPFSFLRGILLRLSGHEATPTYPILTVPEANSFFIGTFGRRPYHSVFSFSY